MPNRIIKESICTSHNLNQLSVRAENFFYRIIVNCDDYGRTDGRVAVLRAKCYPLKIPTVRVSHIESWLQELIKHNLVYTYEIEGQRYLQLITWGDHQQIRAHKSKYPDPNGQRKSTEINGNQRKSDVPVIQSNPIQSESNPKGAKDFELFWKAYPKKKSKGQAKKAFKKLNPDETLLNKMLEQIDRLKKSKDWLKDGGQFIPYPATWINAEGWEDEIGEGRRPNQEATAERLRRSAEAPLD